MVFALKSLVPIRARSLAMVSTRLSQVCLAGMAGVAALPALDMLTEDGARAMRVELARSRTSHGSNAKASVDERADRAGGRAPDAKSRPQAKQGKQEQVNAVEPTAPATSPAQTEAPAAPPEPLPDVWPDTEIIAALKECVRLLGPIVAELDVPPPIKKGECGAPAPVMLRSIGSAADKVEFRPAVPLNCRMVVALHKWVEGTVQPAARQMLGSPIARISGGSYSCRNKYNKPDESMSEHAFANAIDISSFATADGRTINILKHWGPTARDAVASKAPEPQGSQPPDVKHEGGAETAKGSKQLDRLNKIKTRAGKRETASASMKLGAQESASTAKSPALAKSANASPSPPSPSPESQFLHKLHKGACSVFATVLGPEANEEHRNHFHVDMRPYARRTYCH